MCNRFRDLLEDPELGLSDAQLGRLIKELREVRRVIEILGEDIPFAKLRARLWEFVDTLEELLETPNLCVVDGDGNSLQGKEAEDYVAGEIGQVNVLITACTECGELG